MGRRAVIFDVGKTNKKVVVFDEDYQVLEEKTVRLPLSADEDGESCEDLGALERWFRVELKEAAARWKVSAVNVAAYGASLVHTGPDGRPAAPLFDYLKKLPERTERSFFDKYGPRKNLCAETCSPWLGGLNSGYQLYWLKNDRPALFSTAHKSMHLPQYLPYLLTGKVCADIASVGCHTLLYNFKKRRYHSWVEREGLHRLFGPLVACDQAERAPVEGTDIWVGPGIHDSSAALVPFLKQVKEQFVLISTGTWSITLNPFNPSPLTEEELGADCLSFLSFEGAPVKASRLFLGHYHDRELKKIAEHFGVAEDSLCQTKTVGRLPSVNAQQEYFASDVGLSPFGNGPALAKPADFEDGWSAYYCLVLSLVRFQKESVERVITSKTEKIIIAGGFATNSLYCSLMAEAFPGRELYVSGIQRATALGAAMVMHKFWNGKEPEDSNLDLKRINKTDF